METASGYEIPPRPHSRVGATLRALLRTRITTGLITILPIMVTIWIVRIVFGWMRDASMWVIEAILEQPWGHPLVTHWEGVEEKLAAVQRIEQEYGFRPAEFELLNVLPNHVQWAIALVSVFLTVFFLYVVGMFAANLFGRRVIDLLELIVEKVPLVKTIYRSSKQILATFTGDQSQTFQRVCLLPFPSDRMRCVGFITNIFRDSHTGEELCTVFIPTTPNPTTGYLQVLKRADLTELPWSVEEAIRTIMSGGILVPSHITILANRELAELQAGPAAAALSAVKRSP